MSEALKKKWQEPEFRRKISLARIGRIPWNKDKYLSKEHRRKIGLSNKGKRRSEEAKKKMGVVHKGKSLSEKHKRKISLTLTGKKLSEEHKRRISMGLEGRKVSQKTREKLSLANKGMKLSEEAIKKIKSARAKQIVPIKDTKIEVKIQDYLKLLNIDFFTHQYIKEIKHRYQCDILVPSLNLVIECDGDYWHKYPIGKDIDHIRTKELIKKGFKVLRLWGSEIKVISISDFKKRLEKYAQQKTCQK